MLTSLLSLPRPTTQYQHPTLCLVKSVLLRVSETLFILLVSISLQGKVSLSKVLSRTNPSTLYVVLTLAPVAFVLGINCWGLIDFRFVNRTFNIWKESSS